MDQEKSKSEIAKKEEETLSFWEKNHIFQKSLKQTEGGKHFVFYDGPPFATGLPHYGHLLAGTMKDAIPRYRTMRGDFVRRQWGWDCHGLPVEYEVEKQLDLKHKKDIEEYGIGKFNDAARAAVLKHDKQWKEQIPRMGRWVDMKRSYRTMDANYTESIWWAFKELWNKKLIYKGYKSMHMCPRCETTLSNNEVAEGYKEITDISVTAKFELVDDKNSLRKSASSPRGSAKTYVLAWTTTAWTLPGNVALAVGEDIKYVKIKFENEYYVIAKDRVEKTFKDQRYEVIEEFKGNKLVGKQYKPLFTYYSLDTELENGKNGWKIYTADFVTVDDGTGVVHIAPAFGADDMALGKKEKLPFIQHVAQDGTFKKEVKDFPSLSVKPKEDPNASHGQVHQKTDIEIIKHLAHKDLLFAKEKIKHPYPHCWRCDTPLLNYAADSWFVKISELKNKALKENSKIKWIPESIGRARFSNLIADAPDWAISRSRFWGAPLPVWECKKCGKREVIGSLDELYEKAPNKLTKLIVLRHGESEKNINHVFDSSLNRFGLTKAGVKQAKITAGTLKKTEVDFMYVSEVRRARETADILSKKIKTEAIIDSRINEINSGQWDGKPWDDPRIKESRNEYYALFVEQRRKIKRGVTGESWEDVEIRTKEFLDDVLGKHSGKTIAVVTHKASATTIYRLLFNVSLEDISALGRSAHWSQYVYPHYMYIDNNTGKGFDFHRPKIDGITIPCSCGMEMKRIVDVFDCWFESGSMPYAQFHYPFENKDEFEKNNFPADFVAEGVDQTRGWFYNLLMLSVGLFGKTPYKNVLVNGTLLAEDGQKMSKRLKNYPDPMEMVNKYGADAIRYYLLSSSAVRGEDLRFSEKGVDEVYKKIILRLENVVSFYKMYDSMLQDKTFRRPTSKNVLDQWIIARLNELVGEVTKAMDNYELDKATRPFAGFVDDFSTWYIRRSRGRFKGDDKEDKENALLTTHYVLDALSKTMAPFMPFLAEYIYQQLTTNNKQQKKESVHLEKWSTCTTNNQQLTTNNKILKEMTEVRRVVSLGLEARASAGIKVRQPLASLHVANQQPTTNNQQLMELIKDEINVKEIIFTDNIKNGVELDTNITPELKREGQMREVLRYIQDLRKKEKLNPGDAVSLSVNTDEEGKALIEEFEKEIKKATSLSSIEFGSALGEKVLIGNTKFTFSLII